MKIIHSKDVPHLSKPEGTDVHYYMFKDYEIDYNDQLPHTTQTWHHHETIWETLYIIDGELTARWRDAGTEVSQVLRAGDLVQTERTPHTFANDSEKIVRFLVMKHIPSNENHREAFRTDKVLD